MFIGVANLTLKHIVTIWLQLNTISVWVRLTTSSTISHWLVPYYFTLDNARLFYLSREELQLGNGPCYCTFFLNVHPGDNSTQVNRLKTFSNAALPILQELKTGVGWRWIRQVNVLIWSDGGVHLDWSCLRVAWNWSDMDSYDAFFQDELLRMVVFFTIY